MEIKWRAPLFPESHCELYPQLSLSSLKKYLFRPFVEFIWIMCGTCMWVYVDILSYLSSLDICFLLDQYFTDIYSNSIHCSSSVSVVSFARQKFVVLMG